MLELRNWVVGVMVVAIGMTARMWYEHVDVRDDGPVTARLKLIWPALSAMPNSDRLILADLATTCGLAEQPMTESAVAACLQDAAADPNGIFPPDVDQSTVQDRLRQLLPSDSEIGPRLGDQSIRI